MSSGYATLSLKFHNDGIATRMRILHQDPPWRAVRAFPNPNGEALVHLQNVSGGILGGDRLRFEAELGAGAQAQVTSTGATRIYRRGARDTSLQRVSARIGSGALLEYLPDAVIPFAGSSFEQSSEFDLEEDGGLICWETLAAGRVTSGECFAFERFASRLAIRSQGRPLALERFVLDPQLRRLDSIARLGGYRYLATLYCCRVGRPAAEWLALENELAEIADTESGAEVRWGAGALAAHGVVVRGLAREANPVLKGLRAFWSKAKQEIWRRPAVAPRKVQ